MGAQAPIGDAIFAVIIADDMRIAEIDTIDGAVEQRATYPATVRALSAKVTRSATCTCCPAGRLSCSMRDSYAQGQPQGRWVLQRPASLALRRRLIDATRHNPPPVYPPAPAVENDLWGTRGRAHGIDTVRDGPPLAGALGEGHRYAFWHDRSPGHQDPD